MIDPSRVAVCIPTYNEADNIEAMTAAVTAHGYRALVIDDASPDGTGRLADRVATENALVSVLHRREKAGLGPAYAAGFASAIVAGAEVVCEIDCDFSHDPADLPRLVAAVASGADVVIGSRYVPGGATPGWSPVRRFISRGGNTYSRLALGFDVRDATGGFRAFDVDAIRRLDPGSCGASGYAFQVEMTYRAARAGMRIVEVPIVFRERVHGESKMSKAIVAEAMRLVTRWGVDRVLGRDQPESVPRMAQMSGRWR